MIRVRVSREFIEDAITEGKEFSCAVESGLPRGCALCDIESDGWDLDSGGYIRTWFLTFVEPDEKFDSMSFEERLKAKKDARELIVVFKRDCLRLWGLFNPIGELLRTASVRPERQPVPGFEWREIEVRKR